MAVPTSDLNPLGQVFERQFLRAWELFQDDRFDEANDISRKLTSDPRVGDLHRAGCHLILAHSPDDYVFHAEQALALFQILYADPRYPPDDEQKRLQEELVSMAERVLKQARADAERYATSSHKGNDQPADLPPETTKFDTNGVHSILAMRRNPTDMFLTFPAH